MTFSESSFWAGTTAKRKVHDHPLKPNKVPYPLRIHGSVIARVWPQVLIIGIFSCGITCISELGGHRINLGIQTTMISTLGFIVGLALSFRTSSAYANWKEARTQWDRVTSISRNLSRIIWIHGPDDGSTQELLGKKSAINLLAAFPVALKHHLREERGHTAPEVKHLIQHLATYSQLKQHGCTSYSDCCHPMFNPDKRDVTANQVLAHGSLPVEIAYHIASYCEYMKSKGLDQQSFGQTIVQINGLMETVSICERVLRDPVPVAYNIVVSQLVWVFMFFLPFQLQLTLHWISIPATLVTAAMLFGLAEIGLEIENPFGDDSNDLDTDRFAQYIVLELDTLTAHPPVRKEVWVQHLENQPLFPFKKHSFETLQHQSRAEVQSLLSSKALSLQHNDVLKPRSFYDTLTSQLRRESCGCPTVMCLHNANVSTSEYSQLKGEDAEIKISRVETSV